MNPLLLHDFRNIKARNYSTEEFSFLTASLFAIKVSIQTKEKANLDKRWKLLAWLYF